MSPPSSTVSSTIPPRLSKRPHTVHRQFKMRATWCMRRACVGGRASRHRDPFPVPGVSSTRLDCCRSTRTLPYIQLYPQLTDPVSPFSMSPSSPCHAPQPPSSPPTGSNTLDTTARSTIAMCSALRARFERSTALVHHPPR
ncbi:hypothetical protein B0H13DRAFT_2354441 [Mycena leptocephala]|nr:hypothetical protein B0H13DRAFT_2354441 [Mycena leptocephala]